MAYRIFWTRAREGLNVMTLIWANRAYAILQHELADGGVNDPGPKREHDLPQPAQDKMLIGSYRSYPGVAPLYAQM